MSNSITENLLIKNGRIIDPSRGLDIVGDLLIKNGKIEKIAESIPRASLRDLPYIKATGMVVCPGFIDLHCHLREPGFEDKETITTGTRAAAAGGFTTICCMPNTNPPVDSRAVVEYIRDKAALADSVRVLVIGCVSKGRKGEELAEMGDLAEAGVVAFSDDGSPVSRSALMRHALEYSRSFDLPIIDHCEDFGLSAGGVMNEGRVAAILGLRGMPAAAEEAIVARDIALLKLTGGRLHLAHISTKHSVELVRQAKEEGLPITAEVTPHHLTMTEEWVMGDSALQADERTFLRLDAYNSYAKVNPPLRTGEDVEALLGGLKAGIIDAIATDHAPHTTVDKLCEFDNAAFGISGLETALGNLLGLVHKERMDLGTLILKLTAGPAAVLGKSFPDGGTLKQGAPADITIFDPDREWVVRPNTFFSKGKNTPLGGHTLKGKVMATLAAGRIVYKDEVVNITTGDNQ